jgi:hypothetical protein
LFVRFVRLVTRRWRFDDGIYMAGKEERINERRTNLSGSRDRLKRRR